MVMRSKSSPGSEIRALCKRAFRRSFSVLFAEPGFTPKTGQVWLKRRSLFYQRTKVRFSYPGNVVGVAAFDQSGTAGHLSIRKVKKSCLLA
jgi:hypothetical protein